MMRVAHLLKNSLSKGKARAVMTDMIYLSTKSPSMPNVNLQSVVSTARRMMISA